MSRVHAVVDSSWHLNFRPATKNVSPPSPQLLWSIFDLSPSPGYKASYSQYLSELDDRVYPPFLPITPTVLVSVSRPFTDLASHTLYRRNTVPPMSFVLLAPALVLICVLAHCGRRRPTFVDVFQCCYKNGTNGTWLCQYFTWLYLALWIVQRMKNRVST